MFEKAFASLLKNFLGEFVEGSGLDGSIFEEKIQLGVWSGYIVLEQLVLKDKLLAVLGAPISLVSGVIGRLEFRIPWGNLGAEPVVIIVDRVNILLEPKYEWENAEESQTREQTIKQAKLAAAELFASKRLYSPNPLEGYRDIATQWLMDSIIYKMIDNIQITVRDVHIRYEDHTSCPSTFCVGFTLESIHVQSGGEHEAEKNTNEINENLNRHSNFEGKKHFYDDVKITGSNCFRKVIQFYHLSLYWNPISSSRNVLEACSSSFKGRDRRELDTLMFRTIPKRIHQCIDMPLHHYILLPMDLRVDVAAKINPITGESEIKLTQIIDDISIVFEDRQYREIISLATNMGNFSKLEKFSKYRPLISISSAKEDLEKAIIAKSCSDIIKQLRCRLKETTRSWLKYAVNATVYQLRTNRTRFTWDELKERSENKSVYVELWKQKLLHNSEGKIPSAHSSSDPLSSLYSSSSDDEFDERVNNGNDVRYNSIYIKILKANIARKKHDFKESTVSELEAAYLQSYLEEIPYENRGKVKNVPQCTLNEAYEVLRQLEIILPFEDIIFFRSVAENDFSQEESRESGIKSWFTWATGGRFSEENEEDKRKLFEALKYEPDSVFNGFNIKNIDPNASIATITTSIKHGSLRLALSTPSIASSPFSIPFLELSYNGLYVKTNVYIDSSATEIILNDFEQYELLPTELPLNLEKYSELKNNNPSSSQFSYNQLITRRYKPTLSDNYLSLKHPYAKADIKELQLPLFEAFIRILPPNKDVEVSLELELRELAIFASPAAQWVKSIGAFLTWPEDLQFWSEMEMSTMNQLADWKSRMDAKLSNMVANHANIAITAKIEAPVIVISETGIVADGSDMLVVDLGNINLYTEKLAKATHERNNLESLSNAGFTSEGTSATLSPNKRTPDKRKYEFNDKTENSKVASSGYVNENMNPSDKVEQVLEDENDVDRRSINSIKSKFTPKSVATVETIDTQPTIDNENDPLFDIFEVSIKDIEVFMTRNTQTIFGSSSSNIHRDNSESKTIGIVDRFDLSIEIHVSVLQWDQSIPKVKLFLELPELNIRLTDQKLVRFSLFSNKLSLSSKLALHLHRGKINKLLVAMEHRNAQIEQPFMGLSSLPPKDTIIEIDDDDNEIDLSEFYDVESEYKSIKISNINSISDLKRLRGGSLVEQSFSQPMTPRRSLSSRSLSDSFSSVSRCSPQRINRGIVNSPRRNNNSEESKSKLSQFSEDGGYESSHSYDSFMSANDDDPSSTDAIKHMDELRYSIKQRENIRSTIMSEMRILESDKKKESKELFSAFQDELLICEEELHELKVHYLDARMMVDESRFSSMSNINQDPLFDGLYGYFDAYLKPADINQEVIDQKRKIFMKPIGNNKEDLRRTEIFFANINISVINVILSHATSTVRHASFDDTIISSEYYNTQLNQSNNSSEINHVSNQTNDILRLRLSGLNLNVKHRNWDSKVALVMHELDIEDVMASRKNIEIDKNKGQIFFLTSEPSAATGISLSEDRRFVPSDLLRIRYDAVHGRENSDGERHQRHQVRLMVGFVGLNIIQETIVELIKTSKAVFTALEVPSSALNNQSDEDDDLEASSSLLNVKENKNDTTEIALSIKCKGISISLLENYKPLVSLNTWNMTLLSQTNKNVSIINFSIVDLGLYHFIEGNHPNIRDIKQLTQRKIIFGRKNEKIPCVSISSHIDHGNDYVMIRDCKISVASMRMIIVPSTLTEIVIFLCNNSIGKYIQSNANTISSSSNNLNNNPNITTTDTETISLLDKLMLPLLSISSGQFNFTLGEIDVIFPTSYDDTNNNLKIFIGLKQCNCIGKWGNLCQFGGLETSLKLSGMFINICQLSVVKEVDFIVIMAMLPSKLPSNSDKDNSYISRLQADGIFQPNPLPDISFDQIAMSMSVTPIILHVSERVFHEIGNWFRENVFYFSVINDTIDIFTLKSEQSISPNISYSYEDNVLSPSGIADSIDIHCIFHELALSLDADMPEDISKKKNVFSHVKLSEKQIFHNIHPAILPVSRIFYFSMRGLHLSFIEKYDAECKMEKLVSVLLNSINLEYMRAGPDSLKRLICTSKDCLPTMNSEEHLPNINRDDVDFKTFCIKSHCSISHNWEIDINLDIMNIQFTVLTDAIITLATLSTLYQQALLSSLSVPIIYSGSRLEFESEMKMKKKIIDIELEQKILRESSHAHPSSVPLSTSYGNDNSNQSNKKNAIPLKTVIINRKSIMLPKPISNLNITSTMKQCGIWIPSDINNSHANALYFTLNLDANSSYHDIEWNTFGQSEINQKIWSSHLSVTSCQLIMSRIRHIQFFSRIKTAEEDLISKLIPDKENYQNNNLKSKSGFNNSFFKILIMPLSAQILHSILLSPRNQLSQDKNDMEITQKIEAYIQEIELLAFLDYRPILKIIDKTIIPLQSLFEKTLPSLEELIESSMVNETNSNKGVNSVHVRPVKNNEEYIYDDVDLHQEHIPNSDILNNNNNNNNNNNSNNKISPINTQNFIMPNSIFELLPIMMDISNVLIQINQEGVNIFIINDLYSHPVTIARVVVGFLNSEILINSPQRKPPIIHEIILNKPSNNPNENKYKSKCFLLTSIGIEYHNQNIMAWEPVLENFGVNLELVVPNSKVIANEPIYWNINSNFKYESDIISFLSEKSVNNDESRVDSNIEHLDPSILQINFKDVINTNITMPLLESMSLTARSLTRLNEINKNDSNESKDITDLSMMYIRNDTGVMLSYWCNDISNAIDIQSNIERPLLMETNRTNPYHDRSFDPHTISRTISLSLKRPGSDPWHSLLNVPLDGRGCKLFMLDGDGVDLIKTKTKSFNSPSFKALTADNGICIATEIVTKGGVRTLIIRSTMRLCNSASIPVHIQLISDTTKTISPYRKFIHWETVIPANTEISVPANYCNIPRSFFSIQPLVEFSTVYGNKRTIKNNKKENMSISTVIPREFKVPKFPGLIGENDNLSPSSLDNNQENDKNNLLLNVINNDINWRRKLRQKRDSVDQLSYSQWIGFNPVDFIKPNESFNRDELKIGKINLNLNINSKGASRDNNTFDSSMSRLITIQSPVTIVNLLACDIEITVLVENKYNKSVSTVDVNNNNLMNNSEATIVYLHPGESFGCLAFHSTECLLISIRLRSTNTISNDSSWSNMMYVPGCGKEQAKDLTLTTDISFINSSILTVLLDIIDFNGTRTLNFYVPYWIVTSSFLSLQYQHDSWGYNDKTSKKLNGIDALSADQTFDEKKNSNEKGSDSLKKRESPRGIGKARGSGGIVLGPELPIRGISDILGPKCSSEFGRLITRKTEEISQNNIRNTLRSDSIVDSFDSDIDTHLQYKLMQCSYTNNETQKSRLRLRSNGTHWSKYFSLDSIGSYNTLDIESVRRYEESDDVPTNWAKGRPPVRNGNQVFCFGLFTTVADAPFHRTKVIVIIDRYIIVNSMMQTLEVRQVGAEDIFNVQANEETPFWWRTGNQFVQVRLGRFGWSWSGKFSVSCEGEIPLRLFNEHDNTVFFVLVHVIKQGPKICIIFKGGNGVAPYRIENHTLDTFKLYQVSLNNGWIKEQNKRSMQTSLLPYHACAYAWDEPLEPQEIIIEILRHGQSKGDIIGRYSFNRLQSLPAKDHLSIRIIALGPIKILQIHDIRISMYPELFLESQSNQSNYSMIESQLQCVIHIKTLGLSIIDQTPQELVYMAISDISIEYTSKTLEDTIKLEVGRIQIDNQLWTTPFPSMMYPLENVVESHDQTNNFSSYYSKLSLSESEKATNSFLTLNIKRNFTYPGILFIPNLYFYVAPFDVNIDGAIIFRLYSMINYFLTCSSTDVSNNGLTTNIKSTNIMHSALSNIPASPQDPREEARVPIPFKNLLKPQNKNMKSDSNNLISPILKNSRQSTANTIIRNNDINFHKPDIFSYSYNRNNIQDDIDAITISHTVVKKVLDTTNTPNQLTNPNSKLYLQQINLSKINLNVSFNAEGINPVINSLVKSGDSLMSSTLSTVIIAMFSTALKIDNCPLRFSTYNLEYASLSVPELSYKLGFNYALQAAGQIHLVLGSSQLFGNITQILQILKEGIWDFMYLPAIGLITSPKAFGTGVLRGLSSLLRCTAVSLFSTAGHFASSLQIGLITLGVIDSNCLSLHENSQYDTKLLRNRPKGFVDGFRLGITDLINDPLNGFKNFGIRGFSVGLIKGFLKLISKPLYGILDTAFHTTERISFRLLPRVKGEQKHLLKRIRPPRIFSSKKSIQPLQIYSINENIGQELLSRVLHGEYSQEGYLWHTQLREGTILIITKVRVLVFGSSFDFCELHWTCLISQILFLEIEYDKNLLIQPNLNIIDNSIVSSNNSSNNIYVSSKIDKERISSNNSISVESIPNINGYNEDPIKRIQLLKGSPILHMYYFPKDPTSPRYFSIFLYLYFIYLY
jgi:hypothetical protein